MLNSIRSHKVQTEVWYYTEDIDWNECRGAYTAPGIGNDGEEYDVIFEERGTAYCVTDVRRHNT